MDFDVAPVVRAAILDAVDREDFGYVEADLGELTTASRRVPRGALRLDGAAGADLPGRRRARRHRAPRSTCSSAPARPWWCPTPAYPPFFEVVELTGRPVVAAPMVRDGGPRRARPRRDRRRARVPGRARRAAVQPAQPDRTGVHRRDELGALAGDRRPARRPGRRRRGARAARVRRRTPRAVRVGVGRDRRAHGHGHVGVEGVQPRGPEVRAGRRVEPRRRGALARAAACSRSPGRRRSASRRRPRRTATAVRGSTSSSRTSTANRDRLGDLLAGRASRASRGTAGGDVPGVARLRRRSGSTTRPASSSTRAGSR